MSKVERRWEDDWKALDRALATFDMSLFRSPSHRSAIRRIYENDTKVAGWKKLCVEAEVDPIYYADSMIGNPNTVNWNGVKVTANSLKHAVFMSRIMTQLKNDSPITLLEVGAGYGGLIELLGRYYALEKIYILDGAPVNELQKYFLTEAGYGDQIYFETPTEKVDLIVSTNTLGEMDPKVVAHYVKLFESCLKPQTGLMYLFQRKVANGSHLFTDWKDYPFDDHWTLDASVYKGIGPAELIECFGRRCIDE